MGVLVGEAEAGAGDGEGKGGVGGGGGCCGVFLGALPSSLARCCS